jgi:HlyD family secretion protein
METSPSNRIYPPEVIGDTLQDHFSELSANTNVIYLIVLGATVAALLSLPFIQVNVSVTSDGTVRPDQSKTAVYASQSGIVKDVFVTPGDSTKKNAPLLRLQESSVQGRQQIEEQRLERKQAYVDDLTRIVEADTSLSVDQVNLQTARYEQEYSSLRSELRDHRLDVKQARHNLKLQRKLYASESVARQKLEDAEFKYEQLQARTSTIIDGYRRRWLSELSRLRSDVQTIRSELQRIAQRETLHTVRAPVQGTVSQMQGIAPGSYVRDGQEIGVLSPDSDLIARVFVSPQDIGLLQEGNSARFQIHAYNYRNWGFLTGRVNRISDDVQIVKGAPLYVIECSLDSTRLSLPSGVTGSLQKGMTLTARFPIARRSLFELLYQDVSDYLNPLAPSSSGTDRSNATAAAPPY